MPNTNRAVLSSEGDMTSFTIGDLSIRFKLAAYSTGDSILLKKVELPKEEEFKRWLDEAQEWAERSGLSGDDVLAIIAEVRARKRACE